MFLPTQLFSAAGIFLYPAYCTYKALQRRPAATDELERWLQYWAIVGAWTAAEGVVGWILTWLPFYTIAKTCVFLYLSANTRGTPYLYDTILAPFFAENEPAIDAFLANLGGQAGTGARSGIFWLWDMVRRALGMSEEQATNLTNVAGHVAQGYTQQPQGAGQQPGFGGFGQQPQAPQQPDGVAQQAFGLVSSLAGRYMPAAISAVQSATQRGPASTTASTRGFDVPPSTTPQSQGPTSFTAPAAGTSRTFAYAAEELSVSASGASISATEAKVRTTSRNSSDGSLSGSTSGFAEIRREEADGAPSSTGLPAGAGAPEAPPAQRRTSSSWMRWGGSGAA